MCELQEIDSIWKVLRLFSNSWNWKLQRMAGQCGEHRSEYQADVPAFSERNKQLLLARSNSNCPFDHNANRHETSWHRFACRCLDMSWNSLCGPNSQILNISSLKSDGSLGLDLNGWCGERKQFERGAWKFKSASDGGEGKGAVTWSRPATSATPNLLKLVASLVTFLGLSLELVTSHYVPKATRCRSAL